MLTGLVFVILYDIYPFVLIPQKNNICLNIYMIPYKSVTRLGFYFQNIIEVPSVYHKQWAPDYPNYVVLDYNGKKHHIRVRKFSNRVYIADGLKHFRRDMRIYEGVMITFAAPDKNWKFDIHFSPPLHAQTCGRPVHSAREYVFTVDVDNRMIVRLYPLVTVWSYEVCFCFLISYLLNIY